MKRPDERSQTQSGVTALETAIILIAFVVVAAIFAFTVLTTGTFLTERSKESAYSGLQEVNTSMELKGSVVLENTGTWIVFDLAPVTGSGSVDITKLNVTYRDASSSQNIALNDPTCSDDTVPGANFTFNATTPDGGVLVNCILNAGGAAHVWIVLDPSNPIPANHNFSVQIIPPVGSILLINRTAPAQITQITDLH